MSATFHHILFPLLTSSLSIHFPIKSWGVLSWESYRGRVCVPVHVLVAADCCRCSLCWVPVGPPVALVTKCYKRTLNDDHNAHYFSISWWSPFGMIRRLNLYVQQLQQRSLGRYWYGYCATYFEFVAMHHCYLASYIFMTSYKYVYLFIYLSEFLEFAQCSESLSGLQSGAEHVPSAVSPLGC